MAALSVAPRGKVELDPFDITTETAYQHVLAAISAILGKLPSTVTEADIQAAMFDRSHKVVIDTDHLLAIAERELVPVARSVYRRAGEDAISADLVRVKAAGGTIAEMAENAGINLSFTLNNPRAERWASRFAGSMVTEITRAQQRTIRALILRSLKEGIAPRAIARDIQSFVGLHSRGAVALMNYKLGLESRGMLASRVDQLVKSRYAKMLKARAENIARTEVLSAANAGRKEAWDQAYRSGLFGSSVPMKEWSAASGAEQVCADMDGTSVLLYDMFTTALGDFDMPPAHPSCRCSAVIVTAETAGRVPKPGASRSRSGSTETRTPSRLTG